MTKQVPIRLEKYTRREFRKALSDGQFRVAILATGSIEQHLEHLSIEQDIVSSTYIAERIAERLYPDVIVAVPIAIGIAEHHMSHAGTLSAKPGSWLAVMFDAVESLVRHGIKKILILNGHGGNVAPIESTLEQWRLYFKKTQADHQSNRLVPQTADDMFNVENSPIDLQFLSYWDAIPEEVGQSVLGTGEYPGHAQEFETSVALHMFPENVRLDAIRHSDDPGPPMATTDKGRQLVEQSVDGITIRIKDMLGRI